MDRKKIQQIRLIEKITQNILDKSDVKNNTFAVELARKWVKRE